MLAYLQACMMSKEHHNTVLFFVADVSFLCSVVWAVSTLCKFQSLLSEAQILEQTLLAKQ